MYSLYNVIAIYMNNNAIINNSYGRAKDLILLFKISMEGEIICFKYLECSGMRTKTFRQINEYQDSLSGGKTAGVCSWPLIYIYCLG